MNIELKKVKKINTTDVLYDTKLKQSVIYPRVDIDKVDFNYIQKNCLRLKITTKKLKIKEIETHIEKLKLNT